MSKRRTPEELFAALLEYEHDDPEARAISDLTKEETDQALRSHGADPDAVRARGAPHAAEVLARLGAPGPSGVSGGSHVRAVDAPEAEVLSSHAWFGWLAAAAVIAVAAVTVRFFFLSPEGPKVVHDTPPEESGDGAVPSPAERLLATARLACARAAWGECLNALDAAHAADPASDQGVEGRALREAAKHGLVVPASRDGGEKGPEEKGGR